MGATASSAPFAATHPPLPPSLDLLAVFNSDDDDDDDESFFQTIEIEDLDEAPTTVTADPTKVRRRGTNTVASAIDELHQELL